MESSTLKLRGALFEAEKRAKRGNRPVNRTKKFMRSPPNPRNKHFLLVKRLVVPGVNRLFKKFVGPQNTFNKGENPNINKLV